MASGGNPTGTNQYAEGNRSQHETSSKTLADLVRYDAMTRAIAECHSVDEAKDIRDKAKALEAYMRQRNDTENERKLAVIKLRAGRAAGKLLREMKEAGEMARGGGDRKSAEYHRSHAATGDSEKTLTDLGVTKSESSTECDARRTSPIVNAGCRIGPISSPSA